MSPEDFERAAQGIVERIDKLERYIDATMRETLDSFELSTGEYKLVMHLRYGGPPYRGKPGKLAKWLGLSTGAMTNRLDNMERRGLIRRLDDPDDRRGVIVELTDEGKALWDTAVGAQAEKESIVATANVWRRRSSPSSWPAMSPPGTWSPSVSTPISISQT